MISLLNRIADLVHFERLAFSFDYLYSEQHYYYKFDIGPVADALIRAINANPRLSCLDLSGNCFTMEWGPHLQNLLKAVEEHKSIHTLILKNYPVEEDPSYSWLKRLLSRKRNVTVLDRAKKRCTDGSSVDKLYSLNRCFLESSKLVNASASIRPLLVAMALIENASQEYQHTAVLLSDHSDMLCECIQGVDLEELAVSESAPAVAIVPAPRPKRSNKRGPSKRQRK